MASSKKTDYLDLNVWASTDVPQRIDFNDDNSKIDLAMEEHCEDEEMHVTKADRNKWNSPYYIGFYYGDGAVTKTVKTSCSFKPSFGIVFAGDVPPSTTDFTNNMKRNYFGFLSQRISTSGISFSGADIVIPDNSRAALYNEYMNFNVAGVVYCYVLFR